MPFMDSNYFAHEGIEKAVFFMYEHDSLPPAEILRSFTEQFGAAVDRRELVMGLTVLFNILGQNVNEVFNSRCAEFLARLNALRQELMNYGK
jgi:predicted component of type VI protein secretion system